jgi:large subunit ribosomal protein L25
MDKLSLKAEERKEVGRKVKKLRAAGILPANIYGKKIASESISVTYEEFKKIFKEAGETGLIYLKLKDKERPVLVANMQVDPVSEIPLHVDFKQVDLKEKVTANVSVETQGESPAEKQGVGTVVSYIDEIEVEALPTDLPEKFILDISTLAEVDQTIQVKDLKVDKTKVEILTDAETILVKVEPPQKEEVIEVPAPVEGETPAVEGEVPAEGGVAPSPEVPTEEKPQEK